MRPKLFVIHLVLLVGVLIVGLTIVSQVFTSIATATDSQMKDMDLDKAVKEELEPIETEEIEDEEEDNTAKQEQEEEQESNDDTAGTGLEEDIMIDDNYSYDDDDVPLELPFDNPMPFP